MSYKIITIGELEIFEFDFSNKSDEEYIELIHLQVKISNDRLPQKTYFLANVKNASTSNRVIEECKKVIMENQHTKSVSALFNLSRLSTIILKILNLVNANKVNAYQTREDAVAFLVTQFEGNNQTVLK